MQAAACNANQFNNSFNHVTRGPTVHSSGNFSIASPNGLEKPAVMPSKKPGRTASKGVMTEASRKGEKAALGQKKPTAGEYPPLNRSNMSDFF